MKTLQVTSPLMRGKDVERAQKHLRNNPFKQNFMQGAEIDKVFGPETGRACIRAKYWLGYPTKKQIPTYGPTVNAYLSGKEKLPKEYQEARARRLKALKAKPLREKALDRARKDIGMKERPPGSNRCEISNNWGIQGPWCAMAVSTWYLKSGSKAFKMHADFAYVPYMLTAAARGLNGLAITNVSYVRPGDVVCFDWSGDGIADHVGLFESWIEKGKTFRSIEGNTAVGNDSNGGQVMRRERSIGQVARIGGRYGFIHVGR